MWNRSRAAAAAVLLTAASAGAQTAKPESAAEAASAAMERAKRQAAGPMRVILEASKSRRKNGDGDSPAPSPSPSSPPPTPTPSPAPPPQSDSSVRAVASRSAAPPPTPIAGVSEPPTRSAATPPPAIVAAQPPVTVAAPNVVTRVTLSSEALQGKGSSVPVPGLEGTAAAPVGLALAGGAAALPTLGAGPARVKLINRVDPDLGQRQLDDLGRNATVTVDLTIRADGTVGAVALVPPTPRGVQRAVVAALEQWRFEPLPSERQHRVQLLFNPE